MVILDDGYPIVTIKIIDDGEGNIIDIELYKDIR